MGRVVVSYLSMEYGPVFGELVTVDRRRPLDAGTPDQANCDRLRALTLDSAFAHARVLDRDAAKCCLSAVWLLYDFLDESHTISQGIPTAEGSFWHGIMHRREGDFSNAKYWFRKVGEHPVYLTLAEDPLCEFDAWDPFAFVDACQQALRSGGEALQLCEALQQREWELLFDYCYRAAIGS